MNSKPPYATGPSDDVADLPTATTKHTQYSLITFVILVLVSIGLLLLPRSELYYPHVVIDAENTMQIDFLLQPWKDPNACQLAADTVTNSIVASCRQCRIKELTCLKNPSEQLLRRFDESPLPIPSARMVSGVVTYRADHPGAALLACQESQRLTSTRNALSQVVCYESGVQRLRLESEKNAVVQGRAEQQQWLIKITGSIVGLIIFGITAFALIRKFSAQSPIDIANDEFSTVRAPPQKISNTLKRIIDIIIAATLFLILLPILIIFSLLIKINEGSPIFYISRRYIAADSSTTIYKFRTMVVDATSPKYHLNERFMREGYLDIPLSCEVYTPIGRILERTQLVETLQLLNIIFDGMSFVGNRPLPKGNIDLLKKFDGWEERFDSPAGLTGISQIVGKYDLSPCQRLHLERLYSNIYTSPHGNILICDAYIIWRTVLLLLTGRYLDYSAAVAFLAKYGASVQLTNSSYR